MADNPFQALAGLAGKAFGVDKKIQQVKGIAQKVIQNKTQQPVIQQNDTRPPLSSFMPNKKERPPLSSFMGKSTGSKSPIDIPEIRAFLSEMSGKGGLQGAALDIVRGGTKLGVQTIKSDVAAKKEKLINEYGFTEQHFKNMAETGTSLDEAIRQEERKESQAPAPALKEFAAGAMQASAKGVEGVAQTLQTVVDVVAPVSTFLRKGVEKQLGGEIMTLGKLGKDYAKEVERASDEIIGKTSGYGKTIGGAIGTLTAEIPGMVLGAKVGKSVLQSISKIKQIPMWGKELIGLLAEGGIQTEAITAATEGRLATPKEIGTGALIDLATMGTGQVLKKLGDFAFYRTIPTTPLEGAKDVSKALGISESVAKTGISFTRKQLLGKLKKATKPLTESLNSAIQNAQKTLDKKFFTIEEFTSSLKNEIIQNPALRSKLKATPIDIPKVEEIIDETVAGYSELFKYKKLKLQDLQELKVALGQGLEAEYKKAIGATMRAKPITEMELRRKLKNEIEKYVPEAEGVNKELAPLLEAISRLERKGANRGLLYDMLAGGFVAGGMNDAFSNPITYAEKFLAGALLRKIAGTTAGKTITGTALRNAAKILSSAPIKMKLKEAIAKEQSTQDTKQSLQERLPLESFFKNPVNRPSLESFMRKQSPESEFEDVGFD